MSQDAKENQGFGSPGFAGRREEDVIASFEGERRVLEELAKLSSYDPEVVAQGVEALTEILGIVAEVRHEPWTAEHKFSLVRSICDIIAHANGSEEVAVVAAGAVTGTPSNVFKKRDGVVPWTPEQRHVFMDALTKKGLIPPATPSVPPTPGGVPSVGK